MLCPLGFPKKTRPPWIRLHVPGLRGHSKLGIPTGSTDHRNDLLREGGGPSSSERLASWGEEVLLVFRGLWICLDLLGFFLKMSWGFGVNTESKHEPWFHGTITLEDQKKGNIKDVDGRSRTQIQTAARGNFWGEKSRWPPCCPGQCGALVSRGGGLAPSTGICFFCTAWSVNVNDVTRRVTLTVDLGHADN